MYRKEDFLFWKIAEALITQSGYRILKLFPSHKELWLEKKENKKAPIVRLLRFNLDWSNWMQRDIESTAATGSSIRKQLHMRTLPVVNIYVSELPPVDEYKGVLESPFRLRAGMGETVVHSIMFTEGMNLAASGRLHELAGVLPGDHDGTAEPGQEEIEAVKTHALEYARNIIRQEQAVFKAGKPIFTYIFIALQVIVFLLMELNGGSTNPATLIRFGAKFNPLILEGEWWRFFAPIFLHIGFLHILMNTMGLYFIGTAVERIYGSTRFLFIYIFAGFGGSLASFLFSHELSAGASGAIFGCLGALLYFGIMNRSLFFRTMGPTVVFIIIFNLAFGFSVSMVDNAGHLGGLAGGFLAAGAVHFPKKRKAALQLAFLLASTLLVMSMLQSGFHSGLNRADEGSLVLLAQQYVEKEDYDGAYKLLSDYEAENKVTERTYFLLSYAEIKKGMLEDAKRHLLKTIELDNGIHEAHYNLALIYQDEGNYMKARQHAEKAAELDPDNRNYRILLDDIDRRPAKP